MSSPNTLVYKNSLVALLLLLLSTSGSGAGPAMVRLQKHVPAKDIARSKHLQRMPKDSQVALAVTLKLKNEAALAEQIRRFHDPSDPLYGHYLTPEQFTQTYAPTQQELNEVTQYLIGRGLKVSKTHPNRLVINVEGPATDIENAFQLELHQYQTPEGRIAYGPNADPLVSAAVAPRLNGVLGLDSFSTQAAHGQLRPASLSPQTIGSGPQGGLTPSDLRKAYALDSITLTGTGETLAVVEFDGYRASDIPKYTSYYGIANPPVLQNILIDGYSGAAGTNAPEVTLDIEMMMAVASGASRILVYESPNTDTGNIDMYSRIANDNLAKEVSTSWGRGELLATPAAITSENSIFMQMAAQGQSMFGDAGDYGAYNNANINGDTRLDVNDPASQPYVVSVGGTTLAVDAARNYLSETAWNNTTLNPRLGGGGGISSTWPLPSWQTGLATTANLGSSTKRMVPDVSLNSDYINTGYSIYLAGKWQVYGGTSAATPIWTAFMALVNQQRAANHLAPLGFPNPAIYQIASSAAYSTCFHDIKDGSTNLYYPATTGYDLATGWGSFIGTNLFQALTNVKHVAPSVPMLTVQ